MFLVFLLSLMVPARADDIPGDCLQSFKVRDGSTATVFTWIPGPQVTATMSCGTAELLRENLFIQGSSMLGLSDLRVQPDPAKQRAVDAYNALKTKIESQARPGVPQIIFAGGFYLYVKYQLALCMLTSEAAGGSCWLPAVQFLSATYKFFNALYKNQTATADETDMLNELAALKPDVANQPIGPADFGGARSRWIQVQVSLCRAIQQHCL